MIRPDDISMAAKLYERLEQFEAQFEPLVGLAQISRDALVSQLIESRRRVRYLQRLLERDYPNALDPKSNSFDPLKGAIASSRLDDFDEALWLVFLSVHFGRSRKHGWSLCKGFYYRLGQGGAWNWAEVSKNPENAINWLEANTPEIQRLGFGFGNHRKYQSLSANGTGAAITSYVHWVGPSHSDRIAQDTLNAETPRQRFAAIYDSLAGVTQFGRTARFDYVAMLGKLGLVDVEADCMHLQGSSGPIKGARLLLAGSPKADLNARELELRLAPLSDLLEVTYDILEDALCNWQKSPTIFVPFRG